MFAENNYTSEIDSDIQVHGDILWQKERLLNIAIANRLAAGYENVCWIDFDCEFIDTDWRENIISALTTKDLVQCFTTFTCQFVDRQLHGESIAVLYSGQQCIDGRGRANGGAWAASARLLSTGFLLYDRQIAGAGDTILVWLIRYSMNGRMPNTFDVCKGNKKLENSIREWLNKNVGSIRDSWSFSKNHVVFHSHGKLSDRKYLYMNMVLAENNFDPENDIYVGINDGIGGGLIWSDIASEKIRNSMKEYFISRNEDG